jgi:choline dehydrogenase-like flavoprotein
MAEQYPNPNNRVMLDSKLDPLGMRRLKVHWNWSDTDHGQTVRARVAIGQELARGTNGVFELRDVGPQRSDSHHHIGTTRMHRHPRQGVVDADCQIHGIDNVFIAGSSTFPTGGAANPTLTIVALAVRLADHLKKVLRSAV